MSAAGAAMLGLFAALMLEALDLLAARRRTARPPWRGSGEPGPTAYAVSAAVRCLAGAGLAAWLGASGQASGPAGALASGIAAPLLLTQIARVAAPFLSFAAVAGTTAAAPPETATPMLNGAGRVSRLRVKLPAARKKTGDDHHAS
ncbi:hypothetical protein GCM10009827_004340 [Dactylosporangium maewongense]|uniref:Uncharacterized protein n=1 Tax=Dactylosporangium maewongense TaxID=634393 RepID=A0ABN1ZJU3_9ACTN